MVASGLYRINFLEKQHQGHLFLTIFLHLVCQQSPVFWWNETDNVGEISLDDAATILEEVDEDDLEDDTGSCSQKHLRDIPDTGHCCSRDNCSRHCPHSRTGAEFENTF